MESVRDAEQCVGVRARSVQATAWTRRPAAGHDLDVDGAYRELRAGVARGLAYRTGSSDLAEDLTQDVFVDLLLAARRHPPANTRAWLARVAQRRVADMIGSAVRERAAHARLEAVALVDSPPCDPELRLAIRSSMARLSPSQQRIIELRCDQGLSFAR